MSSPCRKLGFRKNDSFVSRPGNLNLASVIVPNAGAESCSGLQMSSDRGSAAASVDSYRKGARQQPCGRLDGVNMNESAQVHICAGRAGTELWSSGAGLDELLHDP